ncbi:MAG TPA: WGR domain-containing protein, partial [Enhygromyxa sp.]|nr:WGR domain-containing protein [Enhygromyxa sp.]
MSDPSVKTIELFFQEQPSDKVYNVALLKTAKGYTVAVEWGRRGAPLSTGTKAIDVTLDKAQKAFDKVVNQKLRKGYEQRTPDNVPTEVAPAQGQGSASKAGIVGRAR